MAASGLLDIRDGLALESAIFARLLQSEQSKARRYFFFRCDSVMTIGLRLNLIATDPLPSPSGSERMTTHAHHLADVPKSMPIRRVGVIGGGTMGSGILVAFLDAGVERATLVEVNQTALDKSMDIIKGIYASRVRRGQMTAEQAAAVGACVGFGWFGVGREGSEL